MTPQGNETNQQPTQGQRVQPDGQQQAVSGQEQPVAYVTKAELDAALQKVISQSQAVVGKLEARVQKKLTDLQSAGIQATPEQAQKLVEAEGTGNLQRQQSIQQGAAQAQPEAIASSDPITAQATEWAKEDVLSEPDPLNLEGYKIMAQAGIRLQEGDPELAMIDPNATPEAWKQQVRAAVEAAQRRKAKEGSLARMPATASGQPTGQPSHSGKTGAQTLDDYFTRLNLT